MMNVSFQGMDELVLTFRAAGGLEKGDFVKVTDNGTVGPCASGDAPVGVALNVRNGFAAVQVRGFTEAEYTGTLALGWQEISAAGKKIAAAAGGRRCLVADRDTAAKTARLILW